MYPQPYLNYYPALQQLPVQGVPIQQAPLATTSGMEYPQSVQIVYYVPNASPYQQLCAINPYQQQQFQNFAQQQAILQDQLFFAQQQQQQYQQLLATPHVIITRAQEVIPTQIQDQTHTQMAVGSESTIDGIQRNGETGAAIAQRVGFKQHVRRAATGGDGTAESEHKRQDSEKQAPKIRLTFMPMKQSSQFSNAQTDELPINQLDLERAEEQEKQLPVSQKTEIQVQNPLIIEDNVRDNLTIASKKNEVIKTQKAQNENLVQKKTQVQIDFQNTKREQKKSIDLSCKNETKNVVKIHSYAFFKYVNDSKEQVSELLLQIGAEEPKFYAFMQSKKKLITTIRHFKEIFQQKPEKQQRVEDNCTSQEQLFKKVLRILAYKFMNEQEIPYFIRNKKIKDPRLYFKFRHTIKRAIQMPDLFQQLKV